MSFDLSSLLQLSIYLTYNSTGVVIVASKGQPMSISFDPHRSIVLFASEAEALNVPIDERSTHCLPLRIDLDGSGEIVRLGDRRQLMEGGFKSNSYSNSRGLVNSNNNVNYSSRSNGSNKNHNDMIINGSSSSRSSKMNSNDKNNNNDNIVDNNITPTTTTTMHYDSMSCLLLPCNIEIRSYLLDANAELSSDQLMSRCLPIHVSKTTYDPHADLVLNDLHSIPAVIDAIDKGMICG